MKKPVKMIIGIVLAIAILIAGISLFFPEVMSDFTSGTFGKAEKYRKTQMTEGDIRLRSEFTSDRDQLREMIQGLIYFSLFTQDLSQKIDSCTEALISQGMNPGDPRYKNLTILKDYAAYIRNNNQTLNTTISMLTGFLLRDESETSADVESNLREFGNYVNMLTEKDSILDAALRTIDQYLLSSRTLQAKKAEFINLKSIRDQLLIGSVQLSAVLQDKPLCGTLCSYLISSQENFNAVLSKQSVSAVASAPVQAIGNQQGLQNYLIGNQLQFGSAGDLQKVIQSQEHVGSAVQSSAPGVGSSGLVGNVVMYNNDDLRFVVKNAGDLQNQISAANNLGMGSSVQLGNLGVVVYFSSEGLNVINSAMDIKNAFMSSELQNALNMADLNVIVYSQESVGNISVYASEFIGFVDVVESQVSGIK